MRLYQDQGTGFTLWASSADTYAWATRPGDAWPCSELAGHRFMAVFDRNGLVDLTVDGRDAPDDFDAHEFNACVADLARAAGLRTDNVAWFVAVGQFELTPTPPT